MIINPILYRHNIRYFLIAMFALANVHFWGVTQILNLPVSPAMTETSITWLLVGVFVFIITNILSFFHPQNGKLILAIVGPVLLSLIVYKINMELCAFFVNDISYLKFLSDSSLYRITVLFFIFLTTTLISMMWYQLGEYEDAKNRKSEMEKMAREAELFRLRQQLQPHFLFNSLNSINALIAKRPDEARAMLHQLSEFLRGTIRRDDDKLTPLQEEMELLRRYLDIEQVRFGHRLQVKFDCQPDALSWKVPPLILQPLLENAIKFGIYGTTGDIKISLDCHIAANYLTIRITNPFDSDMQSPSGTGFGLKSVRRRLYLLYGRADLLETESGDGIFQVLLKIPRPYDQSADN